MERKIPYGQTRSYSEVAGMINNPKASRAEGSANSNNPLPLYFPCHRIINSNGMDQYFVVMVENIISPGGFTRDIINGFFKPKVEIVMVWIIPMWMYVSMSR